MIRSSVFVIVLVFTAALHAAEPTPELVKGVPAPAFEQQIQALVRKLARDISQPLGAGEFDKVFLLSSQAMLQDSHVVYVHVVQNDSRAIVSTDSHLRNTLLNRNAVEKSALAAQQFTARLLSNGEIDAVMPVIQNGKRLGVVRVGFMNPDAKLTKRVEAGRPGRPDASSKSEPFVRLLADALGDSFSMGEWDKVQALVARAASYDPNINYLIAAQTDGVVVASTDPKVRAGRASKDPLTVSALTATELTVRELPDGTVDLAVPVVFLDNKIIGVLRAGIRAGGAQ